MTKFFFPGRVAKACRGTMDFKDAWQASAPGSQQDGAHTACAQVLEDKEKNAQTVAKNIALRIEAACRLVVAAWGQALKGSRAEATRV